MEKEKVLKIIVRETKKIVEKEGILLYRKIASVAKKFGIEHPELERALRQEGMQIFPSRISEKTGRRYLLVSIRRGSDLELLIESKLRQEGLL